MTDILERSSDVRPAQGAPAAQSTASSSLIWPFLVLAAVAAAQAFGVLTSPPDRDMGHLQKIMYAHVPAAWNAFLAFVVVLAGSVMYLWKREEKWDLLAASAAEVAAVLTALTIALGSIWGR